jgi:hypothetical protein
MLAGNAWAAVDSLAGRVLLAAGLFALIASVIRRRPDR